MHIWTETPLTEIWNQMRYLERPSNVCRLLSGGIHSHRKQLYSESEELTTRARRIAACIQQADEYFIASEGVGLATKPLLQFYGAQSLAKALILSNDSGIDLSQLKYHGLSTRASTAKATERSTLQTYTDTPSDWAVESEFAIADEGVFPHLSKAAGDTVTSPGTILRFKDLIRCLPDLAQLYRRHYGKSSHCFYLYSEPKLDNQGRYEVFFSSRECLDDLHSAFPEFRIGHEEIEKHSHHGFRSAAALPELPTFGVVEEGTVAGKYYVRPHASGIHRSLTIIYASLFILSIVVRYKPAFWIRVMESSETGSVSIVEAFCNLARRRYPNAILEGIWHERFTYGTPARLS